MLAISCYRRLNLYKHTLSVWYTMAQNSEVYEKHPLKKCMDDKEDRLVWVDLEMTGLDESVDHIMEAAVLITDGDLAIVAEGPNIIIHIEDAVLDTMNDWCKKQHGKSGLTEACQKSKVSLAEAEKQLCDFVKQHIVPGTAPLAGNSIHADKKFLTRYMPDFMKMLHYRIVDVSSIKELCRRWYPDDFAGAPEKCGKHRAIDDIKESIKELQYYRQTIFRKVK